MQGRRNKRRFVLLTILTVVTLLVFWWVQPENRLDIDQDIFQTDLSTINKVTLQSDSDTVTLAYDGNTWRVNDTYRADADMIKVLFATLQQARPKRAVGSALEDSIYRELTRSGVTVRLYEGEMLKKAFLAGGNPEKTQALFGDRETGNVYVMAIPGYRVYVSGILELPEEGWRNKFVFGFNWRNFKGLEVRFGKRPADNFRVAMNDQYFGIAGIETDTARLNTFLDNVSLLTVDAYVNKPRLRDSLLALKPMMEILITDVGDREYRLRLYDPEGAKEVNGIVQDSQLAVFDRRKIELLLKPKSFFTKK